MAAAASRTFNRSDPRSLGAVLPLTFLSGSIISVYRTSSRILCRSTGPAAVSPEKSKEFPLLPDTARGACAVYFSGFALFRGFRL